MGDHLHPLVDRALHLPGRRPLHHHLRRDPPQNARRKSGIASCYEKRFSKSDFSMLLGSPTVLDQLGPGLQFPGGAAPSVPRPPHQQARPDSQDLLLCRHLPPFPHLLYAYHHQLWDQR